MRIQKSASTESFRGDAFEDAWKLEHILNSQLYFLKQKNVLNSQLFSKIENILNIFFLYGCFWKLDKILNGQRYDYFV